MAYGVVKIGEKEVPMLSMASIDRHYKHIFAEDPIAIQTAEGFSERYPLQIDFYQKMGYAMAMYAQYKNPLEMRKLNDVSYELWLDQFEQLDYIQAVPDIAAIYNGQAVSSSQEKKEEI